MVFEALISPRTAEEKPWIVLLFGFFTATLAVFLSLWVFKTYSSFIMVFLTVLFSLPLYYATLFFEERKDIYLASEGSIFKEHSKAIFFLIMLMVGNILAFFLWYILLPSHTVSVLFSTQTNTIVSINTQISGSATGGIFAKIFMNNIKVAMFSILFSLIFGMGALFILTWNASVIAAAMGNLFRVNMARLSENFGYFSTVKLSLLRYLTHGIPEIAGYVVAGIAGGIISSAIVNRDFASKKFQNIIFDTSLLILTSFIILFFAALIEVYITPALI